MNRLTLAWRYCDTKFVLSSLYLHTYYIGAITLLRDYCDLFQNHKQTEKLVCGTCALPTSSRYNVEEGYGE